MSTILVVEDERDIADLVSFNLTQAGFEVWRAGTGLEALEAVHRRSPDLVVLDIMLPEMDGKEVCRRLKQDDKTRHIPVLMLTALAEETDRIVGFEIGAEDYLTKPFSPRELVLRVKAILRRTQEPPLDTAPIRRAGLVIDPERHQVLADGRPIDLTATEFRLLHFLAAEAGRVQSRDRLLDRVWGYTYEGYARTVDTHVRRLRKKLGPTGDLIETVRGVGYRFREVA